MFLTVVVVQQNNVNQAYTALFNFLFKALFVFSRVLYCAHTCEGITMDFFEAVVNQTKPFVDACSRIVYKPMQSS